MPVPAPALDDFIVRQKLFKVRTIQEMFCKKLDSAYLVKEISNTSNSSGLIKITTSGAHGLSTGNKVIVSGVLGTTEANGLSTITVTSTTEFTLDSSTYANAWAGSGGVYNTGSVISIAFDTTSPTAATVDVNIKYIANGSVMDGEPISLSISSTSTYDIVIPSASYLTAIHSIRIVSNEASSPLTPRVFRRKLASNTITSINLARMSLAAKYYGLIGGDGVLSLYTDAGLPKVS